MSHTVNVFPGSIIYYKVQWNYFIFYIFLFYDMFFNEIAQNNSRGNPQLTIICKMLNIVNTAKAEI